MLSFSYNYPLWAWQKRVSQKRLPSINNRPCQHQTCTANDKTMFVLLNHHNNLNKSATDNKWLAARLCLILKSLMKSHTNGNPVRTATGCNVTSIFSERVYTMYFIALKTGVSFVHRQRATVTRKSLTIKKAKHKWSGTHKKTISRTYGRLIVVMTQKKYKQFKKATEQWEPQKMFIIIGKNSSADSTVWYFLFYKNKHYPCSLYSLKYMFCY